MKKIAGLEATDVNDPKTGLTISVSTTTRKMFRKMYPEQYGGMRNVRLNYVIAEEFAKSSANVVHYFRLGKDKDAGVAEIRSGGSGVYYISAIRERSVDILTVQASWLQPKYKGSASSPMETDEFGRMV
jgi:hypothetical protein